MQKNHVIQEHFFDKSLYDKHALSVVEILQQNGYKAYFVGGCVRDMLLGANPKDFDVLTDARPSALLKLFRNARIIGKRFPIVHVIFSRHFIEITSLVSKNDTFWRRWFFSKVKGSLEEDALRRDFTVNALYYDPLNNELFDPLGAMSDLHLKKLVMIGSVPKRMQEDPVRMLRALRLAAKTGFSIDKDLLDYFSSMSNQLESVSDQRIYLEFVKMLMSGAACAGFEHMSSARCISVLLPAVSHLFNDRLYKKIAMEMLPRALTDIDARVNNNKNVSLVFALAVFFWLPVDALVRDRKLETSEEAIMLALNSIAYPVRIPMRLREGIAELYSIQYSMRYRKVDNIFAMMKHPRFRASVDFLMLRAKSDLRLQELAAWWFDFLNSDDLGKAYMLYEQDNINRFKKHKHRNYKRRR